MLVVGCAGSSGINSRDAGHATVRDAGAAPRDAGFDAGSRDGGAHDSGSGRDAGDSDAGFGQRLYVGSGDWGRSTGRIALYDVATDGTLTQTATLTAGNLATFFAYDAARHVLHVADESGARVLSYRLAPGARPTYLSERATRGYPVYVTYDPRTEDVFVAHYGSGETERYSTSANGAVDSQRDWKSSGGQSHSVILAPDGARAFVASKEDDHVVVYDLANGLLTEVERVATAKGSGPRHVVAHPGGAFVYLINELDSTIVLYAYENGTLVPVETYDALPDGFVGMSSGADIHIHPNGDFLYATNRYSGEDGSIAMFSIAQDGRLTRLGHESTRGRTPRNFVIHPNGVWLYVANRVSENVALFRIEADGRLTFIETEDVGDTPFVVGLFD